MRKRLARPMIEHCAEHRLGTSFRLALAVLLVSVLLLLGACSDADEKASELIVTGSTTLLPIAEISGEMFHEKYPEYKVLVSGLGSSAGIESVAKGSSDIGTSSRDLKDSEMDLGLYDTPVAIDAIAVIVNPDNPIDDLTTEQVQDLFSGKIQNWSELGGKDYRVGLVNRDEASGTREAFSKIVMQGESFDRRAAVLPGTGQVRSVVAQAPGAVGYISLGFVTDEVKAVAIDGVEPSVDTVLDGSYPVQRTLHFFTVGEPQGLAKKYIDFVLSDEVQESIVREAGFLPISSGSDQ